MDVTGVVHAKVDSLLEWLAEEALRPGSKFNRDLLQETSVKPAHHEQAVKAHHPHHCPLADHRVALSA